MDLGTIAVVQLKELGLDYVPLSSMKTILANETRESFKAVVVGVSTLGGCSNSRIAETTQTVGTRSGDFLQSYYRLTNHSWGMHAVYLINRPCYIIVETGVIILDDGRVIQETIYPSAGELSVARLLGGGVDETNFISLISDAEVFDDGIWAPLLSRWGNVYFHAVSESMVQDALFERVGLSQYLSYAAPNVLRGTQSITALQAKSTVIKTSRPIVKVKGVMFSSLLYTHAVMGNDFLNFVDATKLWALENDLPLDPKAWQKVYISRAGASARRMANEKELSVELQNMGFRPVQMEGLTFREQVRTFRDARLVVGPHGAGLTNAAFARPGSTLFELRPLNRAGESPYWGTSYLKLSNIMGFKYCAHISENDEDSDAWEANIPEILQIIKAL